MEATQDEKKTPDDVKDPGINLEALAEILFQLMRRELLLENERLGK